MEYIEELEGKDWRERSGWERKREGIGKGEWIGEGEEWIEEGKEYVGEAQGRIKNTEYAFLIYLERHLPLHNKNS